MEKQKYTKYFAFKVIRGAVHWKLFLCFVFKTFPSLLDLHLSILVNGEDGDCIQSMVMI